MNNDWLAFLSSSCSKLVTPFLWKGTENLFVDVCFFQEMKNDQDVKEKKQKKVHFDTTKARRERERRVWFRLMLRTIRPLMAQSHFFRLLLVRHGESEANLRAETHVSGRMNETPLTPKGQEQAREVGRKIAQEGPSIIKVFCSPAVRTRETARLALEEWKQLTSNPHPEIEYSEDLYEIDMGDWVGQERSVVYNPQQLDIINADPWHFRPPNGESPRDVEERMVNYVEKNILPVVPHSAGDGTSSVPAVLLFGHGFSFKCLIRYANDAPPEQTHKIPIDNTSITEFLLYKETTSEVDAPKLKWKLVRANNSHVAT
eukprot:TRINITY_DN3286_c0_g1_i2.p1 TRINITY_DN3286_c0_g1~~TRINITY_DN3286_c0_g1_i2.p1  ORF type:complete len:316 (+),score=64.29 TRINITY_DN3286_c0_g1_i2:177-1124(+)